MALQRNSIKDLDSAKVPVIDPTTKVETGMVIELAGPEHPKRKAIELGRARKQRAQFQATGKVDLGDPADDEQDAIEKLAACTLGWDGYVDEKGVAIPCTPANAQEFYASNAWARVGLLTALGERERFIKSSVTA